MKSNKLVLKINKSPAELFAYTVNPDSTPNWIDFISAEETNEFPPKLGTIYRNQNQKDEWTEYIMTEFEQDKTFVMSRVGGDYHVRYSFIPVDDGTEMEYYEWVDQGELEEPFNMRHLEKLKSLLETE